MRISAADLLVQTNYLNIWTLRQYLNMFTHSGKWDCMTMSVKDLNKWKIIYLDAWLEFKSPKKYISTFVVHVLCLEKGRDKERVKTRETDPLVDLNNSLDAFIQSCCFIPFFFFLPSQEKMYRSFSWMSKLTKLKSCGNTLKATLGICSASLWARQRSWERSWGCWGSWMWRSCLESATKLSATRPIHKY